MKLRTIILTFLVILGATAAWSAETLTLTQDGKTDYTVVVPDDASAVQLSAANELTDTLRTISGATFPVKKESDVDIAPDAKLLVIGPGAASKLLLDDKVDEAAIPYDGIVLKQVGSSIVFSGHPVRGPLYAVYTFLEDELGCRWWTGSESFFPKTDSIKADDFDQVYAPKLIYREPYYTGLTGEKNARFAAHVKTNGAAELIPPELGGHHKYQYFVHSFYTVIQPEEFLDHPEWFSEIDGRRKIGGWWGTTQKMKDKIPAESLDEHGTQLCLTNEELCQTFLERIRKDLDANPEATIVSVSQNDCHGPCQCANCAKIAEEEGSESGPLLYFVNKIAEGLAESHPGVLVDTLAYQYTRKPPKTIKARENVIVRLCSIECSFNQNLDGEFGPSFADGNRRPAPEPENRSFREDMEKWNEHADRIFIWDYVTDFSQYIIPFPNYRILSDNVRFFVNHNTIGLFEQGNYQGEIGEFVQMRAWVLAKLLWNPGLNQKTLMEDFLSGYYAPELTPLYMRYFDLLCDASEKSGKELRIFERDNSNWLDLDTYNACAEILDRVDAKAAELEADNPSRYQGLLAKVRRERLSLDMELLLEYNRFAEQAQNEGKEFRAPARGDMPAFCDEFRTRCQSVGLDRYSEMGGPDKFEQYLNDLSEKIASGGQAAE